MAIEIDGSQHIENAERDAARTVFLEKLGWRVMRFWNSEVRKNPDGVAEAILASLVDPRGPTHPPTPPFQGGEQEGRQLNQKTGSSPGLVGRWIPHSTLSQPRQRPARGSSPGSTFDVHGLHPIDG